MHRFPNSCAYLVSVLVALTLLPANAWSQSSASYRLSSAALNAGGGVSQSASFALNGCLLPDPLAGGGSASASFALLAGGCAAAEPAASCGNGVVEAGEACDDGNTSSGDCCSADCSTVGVSGSACGDAANTDCTDPDSCDSLGNCQPNDASAGTTAPTQCDDTLECTLDQCDGSGGCQNPPAPSGAPC